MPQSEPVFLGLNEGTWFAVIALLLTMIVSIAATVIGYRSASKDRESRIVLSYLDHQHERDIAREARTQNRLEEAYAELAIHMDRLSDVVNDRLQRVRFKPEPPPTEFPPPEDQRRIIARVRLHGSTDVRALVDEMSRRFMKFRLSIGMWEELKSFGTADPAIRGDTHNAYEEMEKDGRSVLDTIARLEVQLRRELGIAEPAEDHSVTSSAPTGTD